jgi:monoterpene epsilon-lactone hydrolase
VAEAGVKVEERIVPWPQSISEKARAFLGAFVDEDGALLTQPRQIAPDDLEGWERAKAASAAALSARLATMPPALSSVRTIEVDGVVVHEAIPPGWATADRRTALEIHGGGFVNGAGEFCRRGAQMTADLHNVRCWSVDYRTPPQAPFPLPLEDCVAAYRALLRAGGAENVIVTGVSAGANLAAALVLKARDLGLSLPAAVVLRTPELDLTESGDSFEVNKVVDVVLGGSLASSNAAYAQGQDLRDPLLSPLFADFEAGFPPTFLDAGTRDLFLSNAVRMHRVLRRAGVPVELHVHEAMPHGGFGGAPEDVEAALEVRRFVAERWPK